MTSSRRRGIRVMLRGLRARCPACGIGRVFASGLASEPRCASCGWCFERCPGHWVGGNEINLIVAFATGVAAWAVAALVLGIGTAAAVVATAVTVAFSLAFYRSSRGLFFAIDYLIDPVPDAGSPPAGGRGDRPLRRPPARPDADHRCGATPTTDPSSVAVARANSTPRSGTLDP